MLQTNRQRELRGATSPPRSLDRFDNVRLRRASAVLLIVVTVSLLVLAPQLTFSQEVRVVDREYRIKAAFLFHFANFEDWPADALPEDSTMITIGILGDDPFEGALETIEGKNVKGRTLRVKRYRTLHDLEPCQVLFICASERASLPATMKRASRFAALTVSDMPGFADVLTDEEVWAVLSFIKTKWPPHILGRQQRIDEAARCCSVSQGWASSRHSRRKATRATCRVSKTCSPTSRSGPFFPSSRNP